MRDNDPGAVSDVQIQLEAEDVLKLNLTRSNESYEYSSISHIYNDIPKNMKATLETHIYNIPAFQIKHTRAGTAIM